MPVGFRAKDMTRVQDSPPSFLVRHEFLIRRLHSLSGLVPVGAFMCVHLLVNASVLESPAAFQKNVYQIHSLGSLLPVVEWVFIFIPILFHAIIGVVIVMGGIPNTGNYPYAANRRYTLQRVTGMIAFVFIAIHVFHMHGWIHQDTWLEKVVRPLGGAEFHPYSAASSAGLALQSYVMVAIYLIGVLACVFHLANGIWTMGITWGVWISPKAQKRASNVCAIFGLLLAIVGVGALFGMRADGAGERLIEARQVEDKMYEHKLESGELKPNEHKRGGGEVTKSEETSQVSVE
ncbi:Succinate dehydrogenase cytochrome b558 subunit [Bythopirellula polymerisocia]|uniref:Succinate dehydrogenase cytochrome b558 subunit n=2 Tax=Bythopirellula polymerisocia TaxID=2528003 RepID=A0A5C6D328_9BACT|nr:Succinate dehydrogenase cytochrome b558 subunit [Bythopirellula polymerisocia]